MSCNGCRILRKGCSESCVLRPCLQWIDGPEAQGHATVFVAKFFGRAGLMSFISAVPEPQRPALFQSLLFEACGRTINPVNGAVGLLWTGKWDLCQAAVEKVLQGGTLSPLPEQLTGADTGELTAKDEENGANLCADRQRTGFSSFSVVKRRKIAVDTVDPTSRPCDLGLCLTPRSSDATSSEEKPRPGTPSMNSDESVATSSDSVPDRRPRLLDLFI